MDKSPHRHLPGLPDAGNMLENLLGKRNQSWRKILGWYQHLELCLQRQAEGLPVALKQVKELFFVDPVGLCFDAFGVPLSWTN